MNFNMIPSNNNASSTTSMLHHTHPPTTSHTNRKRRSSEITNMSEHKGVQQQLSPSMTLPMVTLVDRIDDCLGRSDHTVNYLFQKHSSNSSTSSFSSGGGGGSTTSSTASMPGSSATTTVVPPPPPVVTNQVVTNALTPMTKRTMDNKKMISSPQDFFMAMLQARGYPGIMPCSLKCGYHNSPTKHQMASYGVTLTKAIRSSDTTTARTLLAAGLHPNACNKFGESIIHAACRRGDYAMLRALIEAGSSVQVTDDFGRTPLHDACWTSSPNFDTIRCLLDEDPWLLCVMDCRGSTPLGYVRKAHWGVWIGFLGAIADRYWPALILNDEGDDEGQQQDSSAPVMVVDREGNNVEQVRAPPLARVEPNMRPLPDPTVNDLGIEVIELLANGKLKPQDLNDEGAHRTCLEQGDNNNSSSATTTRSPCSRITLDPLRSSGSNATTMLKGS